MLSKLQGPAERVALVGTSSSRRTVENPPLPDAQHTGTEFRDSRAKRVAMEDSMTDLYAINLHLQERLERYWRKEVRAAEAAIWLDDAGLLRDYKRGLPLRRLLRAGRIAGQQQRPDGRNGSWWIRRLAESRDAMAIQQARRQIRRYLPIDRDILHAEWPLIRDTSIFWEELGRTVAAFGYLENELTSACYTRQLHNLPVRTSVRPAEHEVLEP